MKFGDDTKCKVKQYQQFEKSISQKFWILFFCSNGVNKRGHLNIKQIVRNLQNNIFQIALQDCEKAYFSLKNEPLQS